MRRQEGERRQGKEVVPKRVSAMPPVHVSGTLSGREGSARSSMDFFPRNNYAIIHVRAKSWLPDNVMIGTKRAK